MRPSTLRRAQHEGGNALAAGWPAGASKQQEGLGRGIGMTTGWLSMHVAPRHPRGGGPCTRREMEEVGIVEVHPGGGHVRGLQANKGLYSCGPDQGLPAEGTPPSPDPAQLNAVCYLAQQQARNAAVAHCRAFGRTDRVLHCTPGVMPLSRNTCPSRASCSSCSAGGGACTW